MNNNTYFVFDMGFEMDGSLITILIMAVLQKAGKTYSRDQSDIHWDIGSLSDVRQ